MHLDEETVQRFLHGELPRSEELGARSHLSECDDCRRRFSEAEREEAETRALLAKLDTAEILLDAQTIAGRARSRRSRPLARAAGILLAVGVAGAAYAMPGSPVREWVRDVAAWIEGRQGLTHSSPGVSATPEPSTAGIAVDPGSRLVVAFDAPSAGGSARIQITEDAEVKVRAPGGAASFTSAPGRLVIQSLRAPITFEIDIPRAAPLVEIDVDGRLVFLKKGPSITPGRGAADSLGGYLLHLTTPEQ